MGPLEEGLAWVTPSEVPGEIPVVWAVIVTPSEEVVTSPGEDPDVMSRVTSPGVRVLAVGPWVTSPDVASVVEISRVVTTPGVCPVTVVIPQVPENYTSKVPCTLHCVGQWTVLLCYFRPTVLYLHIHVLIGGVIFKILKSFYMGYVIVIV